MNRKIRLNRKINAVDLFCGAGGLTKGLEQAGINVNLGVDSDPACEFPYTANNQSKFLLKAIERVNPADLEDSFDTNCVRLLAGCAPCQTFSTYYPKAGPTDKRWWLLLIFSDLVKEIKPELVTMENVPKLRKHHVFNNFIEDLDSSGYEVFHDIVNCSEYGIPQHRPRLVLLASRLGPIKLLTPKQLRWKRYTVREKIEDLTPLEAGQQDKKDPLHTAACLSDMNLKRIKASIPGGTWRDWDPSLVASCHRKGSGKTYPSVYGRMSWDEPAPTITTQFFGFGNGRFGHPEQDRAISLREGAILQSFPKSYKFVEPGKPISRKNVGRLIGNAVPVKLGKAIGVSFQKHIEKMEIKNGGIPIQGR